MPRDRVSPPLESDESETCILYILGVGGEVGNGRYWEGDDGEEKDGDEGRG